MMHAFRFASETLDGALMTTVGGNVDGGVEPVSGIKNPASFSAEAVAEVVIHDASETRSVAESDKTSAAAELMAHDVRLDALADTLNVKLREILQSNSGGSNNGSVGGNDHESDDDGVAERKKARHERRIHIVEACVAIFLMVNLIMRIT